MIDACAYVFDTYGKLFDVHAQSGAIALRRVPTPTGSPKSGARSSLNTLGP
jgi:hypothetical protein